MANQENDFAALTQQWYQQWEKGMTAWWDQVLDSPSFLGTMGDNLANQARARGAYAKMVDDGLASAHLPTRNDLIRVLRIATMLEEKILGVEDRLLTMQDSLQRIEKEALTARIEAAESRVELTEKLAALQAKLAELEAQPAASSTRKASTRKPSTRKPSTRKKSTASKASTKAADADTKEA